MDYGMFFIHNLDLKNHYIRCIVKVDPKTCREHMGRGGKVPRRVAPIEALDKMGESGHYPLRERPSWTEIKGFMGRGAQEFMLPWVWDPEWGSEHATAARLFTRFTREYFATLKINILRADAPSPINLEDAMKT
jgi:hypothetical protein